MEVLTESENEVIRLKALGLLEKEIADRRCVSIHTIKTQVKRAIRKAKAKSGYHLIAKYAAMHPELFRNMMVAICLTAQTISMAGDIKNEYKRPAKQRTFKTVKARRKN